MRALPASGGGLGQPDASHQPALLPAWPRQLQVKCTKYCSRESGLSHLSKFNNTDLLGITVSPSPRFLKSVTPSCPPAKGCSCLYLAAMDCTGKCPGSWGLQSWPGSSTPRGWSGRGHTCTLPESSFSEDTSTLEYLRLDGTVEGRMAPPLYRDPAGPKDSSCTWYGTGLKVARGAIFTAEDWPKDPTRHLNWSVSLQKEPLRRKEEAEKRKEETERLERKVPRRKRKVRCGKEPVASKELKDWTRWAVKSKNLKKTPKSLLLF